MTKLSGQFCAVLFAGYDLSARSRQFDWTMEFEEEDATAFLDGVVNTQEGLANIEANVVAFMDPVETDTYVNQSWKALKTPGGLTTDVLMILIGQGATPDEGDPALAASIRQYTASVPANPREKVIANAKFRGAGYVPQIGLVMDYATITDTKTSDTIDLGAAAPYADGANAYLVLFLGAAEDTPGTDTYSIKVQHNTLDDGSWVDYLTFAADGSVRTSERKASASSINRYVRLLCTRTGAADDSVGVAVVLALN